MGAQRGSENIQTLERCSMGDDICVQNGNGGGDDSSSEDAQTGVEEAGSSAEETIVTTAPREVYIVDSVSKAEVALKGLRAIHAANPDTIFACDTEVPLGCSWLSLTAHEV